MAGVAEKVFELIAPTVLESGVELWDVRFVKEGASRYLRVFIDKPEGITVDDCTAVSHLIDPIIDEADPIDTAYYLEVCSPGLERELLRPEHFERKTGEKIRVKLYKASDGKKEFTGILKSFDGQSLVLCTDDGEICFTLKEISKAQLCDFENQ